MLVLYWSVRKRHFVIHNCKRQFFNLLLEKQLFQKSLSAWKMRQPKNLIKQSIVYNIYVDLDRDDLYQRSVQASGIYGNPKWHPNYLAMWSFMATTRVHLLFSVRLLNHKKLHYMYYILGILSQLFPIVSFWRWKDKTGIWLNLSVKASTDPSRTTWQ